MYHKVIIVGNLGADPEMRYTPTGTPVTHFRMAASRVFVDAEGNRKKVTTWFRVTAWGKLAEQCNEYLQKGRLVLVEGVLVPDESGNPRVWVGSDGTVRASYEVRAERVKFLGPRPAAPEEAIAEEGYEALPELGEEEEIPF
jgi:single-strand DNA-binding protein